MNNSHTQQPPVLLRQWEYPHIPYPAPDDPARTIATSGCGLCCLSMIAQNMLGTSFPLEENAQLAIACGARENDGTNLYRYAPVFAAHFGMSLIVTEQGADALRFLQEGKGMAVANVRGDRDGYVGVFSNSGHYIVLAGAQGTLTRVWDPMLMPGRYDTEGRKGKVRVDGIDAYAEFSVIESDCFERPYFLFSAGC